MLLRKALLSARAPPRAGSALRCRSARILCFSSSSADDPDKPPTAAATAPSFLSDERIRVGDDYNRWKQLVPALSAGVSIGTYVAVPSVLGMHICSYQGVVAPIATDFTLSQLMLIAPAMPALGGLAAFMLADQNFGHRRMAFVFSVAYPATVYGLSAAAISANNLYAFGTSYALLGGLAFYCGYPQLPPFLGSTWFHDRPGLLTSTYFTSFGASLYLSNQVLKPLLAHFQEAPVRLGGIDEVSISFGEHGKAATISLPSELHFFSDIVADRRAARGGRRRALRGGCGHDERPHGERLREHPGGGRLRARHRHERRVRGNGGPGRRRLRPDAIRRVGLPTARHSGREVQSSRAGLSQLPSAGSSARSVLPTESKEG